MLRFPEKCLLTVFMAGTFITVIFSAGCHDRPAQNNSPEGSTRDSLKYVGRESCKSCHEKQYEWFSGSDHDRAMDIADSISVLGDFNHAVFFRQGITSEFYKKDDGFYVFTEGPDGGMAEFKVDYVFGVRPLQQYLVAFPGGRYQCLPLCWDTRPKEEGGQRWFHIYGDEEIPYTDFLYWTRVTQNWNYMCAECHSTNLKKNFNASTDSYHTTWSEIDVSCEACHGPCSAHIRWAGEHAEKHVQEEPGTMGLVIRHKDPQGGTWVFKAGKHIAERTVTHNRQKTLETCARCHARRSTIYEDYTFGRPFLDTHRPSLLEDPLYFPDGQIHDEVYVYASFLQSKMYHQGVICSDCHEPHSLKVYVQGNALCYRCHLPDKYGAKSHHFHHDNSTGALCVECHMPERTYMQVDPRRDHSMRNPRPDLTLRLNTPNACNRCHQKLTEPPGWSDLLAADYFVKWYGKKERGSHYGEIFWEARLGYPEALPGLVGLAIDTSLPAMVRSTSYYYLSNYRDPAVFEAVQQGIKDPDPLVRFGAFEGSLNLPDDQKTILYKELLYDPVRLVRTRAAGNMPVVSVTTMNQREKERYDRVLAEYLATGMINADHPYTWVDMGNYYLEQGNFFEAEKSYLRAIAIEPALSISYINLADLCRRSNQDSRGEELLLEALLHMPESSDLNHAMGLLLIREKRIGEGIDYLKKAAGLSPDIARYGYVYGVALYSTGNYQEAISFLEQVRNNHPFDRDVLFALVSYYAETGQWDQSRVVAEELVRYYPDDSSYQEILRRLKKSHRITP